VETIFTKIPNCCHYPPPYCTPQDGTRAVRREGGRAWGDKFGKVLLKTLPLNYDILGTGRKKESHLLIGKYEINPSARAQVEGSGLILSGAFDPVLKDGVWRRRSINVKGNKNVLKGSKFRRRGSI